MHKLLQQQLESHLKSGEASPELRAFLEAVSRTYEKTDEERELLERSLALNSHELLGANARLREDLEKQALARSELERQRQELLEIIQRSPFPIAIRRVDRYVFLNQAWADCLGYASAELIGRSLLELMHPDDVQAAVEAMRAADLGASRPPTFVRFRKKSGSDFVELEVHAVRQISFEGAPSALLAAIDVTERKRLQAQIMSADRMVSVGTLAAGVAHEINNPLSYVIGNLSYLADHLAELPGFKDTELVKAFNDARQGAERVANIVRDLKTVSRKDEQPFAPVNVEDALDSAVNVARNEIRHRARIVRNYAKVPPVSGDAGKLGQLFLNLLVNAAQAMPDGAADRNEIRLITRRNAEGGVVVEIGDTGSGIPEEIRRRIFDPFFTTKPVGVGTGLGLYICQGIVRDHRGEMELESEVGRGTVFRITLPAAGAAAVRARRTTPTPIGARAWKGRRLLVVDDEPNVGAFIRRVLGKEYEVAVETDARQALARFVAGEHFDLILCDVMMPAMSGADLYRELQKVRPDVLASVVFMSGGAFSPGLQHFLQGVPNPKLDKPLDLRLLRSLLELQIR